MISTIDLIIGAGALTVLCAFLYSCKLKYRDSKKGRAEFTKRQTAHYRRINRRAKL